MLDCCAFWSHGLFFYQSEQARCDTQNITGSKYSPYLGADEGLGGDPELEAAERNALEKQQPSQEEESDEDDWTPKDAKELAKKEKQMARSGITFHSKVGPPAKVSHLN